MTTNGTTASPLFGAGHQDSDGVCGRCGAAVFFTGDREHPLAENEDGGAHALTCAGRVKSAALLTKKGTP